MASCPAPFPVGFAAESHNLLAHAQAKRRAQRVPLLVLTWRNTPWAPMITKSCWTTTAHLLPRMDKLSGAGHCGSPGWWHVADQLNPRASDAGALFCLARATLPAGASSAQAWRNASPIPASDPDFVMNVDVVPLDPARIDQRWALYATPGSGVLPGPARRHRRRFADSAGRNPSGAHRPAIHLRPWLRGYHPTRLGLAWARHCAGQLVGLIDLDYQGQLFVSVEPQRRAGSIWRRWSAWRSW